jgi:membrane protease YdiL (CAAX protease family)
VPKETASPRNLLTSLILIFPLFLIYQVGVLFTLPMLNGADFVTLLLFGTLGLTLSGYLAFLAALILVFAITVLTLKRHQRFEGHRILPILLESTIYAVTMGSLIVFVMTKVMGFNPELSASLTQQGMVTRTVMSLGAGVYEEIVFRLGVLNGLRVTLEKAIRLSRPVSVISAFVVSSLLFSAVHYIPPYGDDLAINSFTFRFLAGLVFALIFRFRGLAVAVYTHAFYDIFVLVLR